MTSRAQSSNIGLVLLLALTITSAGVVVAIGGTALTDVQQEASNDRASHAMTLLDARAAVVGLGEGSVQTVRLGRSNDGQYTAESESGWLRIRHTNYTGTSTEEVYNASLGSVSYRSGDTTIAYQGGGVWRHRNGGTTMVSPPEFHYRGTTLTLPVLRIRSDDAASGGATATIRRTEETARVFPNETAATDTGEGAPYDVDNPDGSTRQYRTPVRNGTVFITSAGNGYRDPNDRVIDPSKQKTNIITVGSVDQSGGRWYHSEIGDAQNGTYKPDVVAPGSNIPSAGPPDRIPEVSDSDNGTEMSGTSQATPHVSGVAALYMQMYYREHGEMPTPEQVRAALIQGSVEPPGFGQNNLDNRPISLSFEDETGTGIVNAYNTYLTFTYAGESNDPTLGSTDRESTISVSTPSVLPAGRLSDRSSGPFLGATLYHQDQGDEFDFSADGTNGDTYGPINTVNSTVSPGSVYTYTLRATNFDGLTDSSEEWAVSTLYPPIGQTVDSQQVDAYSFRGPLTLDPDESAAYAVPNGESLSSGNFIDRDGGIRAIAYYDSAQGDINISASVPGGQVSAASSMNVSEYETEQVVTREPSDTGKVIFTADGTTGTVDLAHASNYPLIPLPSTASVTNDDMNAGNASNPNPVEFDVTIDNANFPYDPSPSGAVDASHFTVTVGSKQVPTDRITLTRIGSRPGKYHLKFTPPKQPAASQYNLTVQFTDSKLGVSHTTTTTKDSVISYTGTGTGGSTSASVLIIDDSGSMGGTKMSDAKKAAKEYVALLSDSDKAAISRFDSGASTAFRLSLVKSNRSGMRTSVDSLNAGGGTDIGEGLNVGYTEISKANTSTPKAAILLTDGRDEFGGPAPRNADDQYANADIPVYTIALGSRADEALLKDIANDTSGEFKAAPTSAALSDIYADLGQTVTGSSTIASTSGSVSANSQATQTFNIDDSTSSANFRTQLSSGSSGSNVVSASDIDAEATTSSKPSVRLQFPNGTTVNMSQTASGYEADPSTVEYTKIGDTHIYRVDDPDPGAWSTTIENGGSQSKSYSVSVTGSTSATLSLNTGSAKYVNGSKTTLRAQFVNQSGGISGASVTGTVTLPDGSTKSVSLTEQSAGVYGGTISNTADGKMSVTVDIKKGNVTRQKSTSWSVVDASTVLQIGSANKTTPSGAEGGTVVADVNLTLPSASSTTATTDSVTNGTQTDADGDDMSDFESTVREVAGSDPGTYNESAVEPAVRVASEVLRNQSEGSVSVDAVTQPSGGSGKQVYLQMGELTGPGGATIPTSNTSVSPSVVTLASGQTRAVRVSATTNDDVTPGLYNGILKTSVSGTTLTYNVTVNVTEATVKTYKTRIRSSAQKWKDVGPSGKSYYEKQIADHLTQMYFDTNSGGSSGGYYPQPRTGRNRRPERLGCRCRVRRGCDHIHLRQRQPVSDQHHDGRGRADIPTRDCSRDER